MSWQARFAGVIGVLALGWAACSGSTSDSVGPGVGGQLPACEIICKSDADCPSGVSCTQSGVCGCSYPCVVDSDCSVIGNEVCGPGGFCVLAPGACTSNAECDGGICELGACMFESPCVSCASNADCDTSLGEVCDTSTGVCVQGTGGAGGAGTGGSMGTGGKGGAGGQAATGGHGGA